MQHFIRISRPTKKTPLFILLCSLFIYFQCDAVYEEESDPKGITTRGD